MTRDILPDAFDLFADVATRFATRPAVVEPKVELTYEELWGMMCRIGAVLETQTKPKPRVAILLPQGAWAYAAMFATLGVGGTYIPLNIAQPDDKLRQVIDAVSPDAIVYDTATAARVAALSCDALAIQVETLPLGNFSPAKERADLAYIIFTSGSTGIPKGVMIPRTALAHYVAWAQQAMSISPSDRWSQHPNIGFDLSVLDIFGALCSGACLYPLVSRKDRLMPATAIKRHQLTIWNSVPSVMDLMHKAGQLTKDNFGSLRLATFCGEPLLESHLDWIFNAHPDLVVHNTYGPTEATVSFTLIELNADTYRAKAQNSIALGAPISGMELRLMGGENDQEGEIVAVGEQVARGYFGDERQTEAAFFEINENGQSVAAYRTGDWAIQKNGEYYFQSRIDRQIKRFGFRIELGEIDAALRAAGFVGATAALKDGSLIGFIEGDDPELTTLAETRLRDYLASYAIPDRFRVITRLPRNQNDKIDINALVSMEECANGG